MSCSAIGNLAEIVQSVIEHFSAQYGTEVAVTVDIEAWGRVRREDRANRGERDHVDVQDGGLRR
jgi:hypothetical protein